MAWHGEINYTCETCETAVTGPVKVADCGDIGDTICPACGSLQSADVREVTIPHGSENPFFAGPEPEHAPRAAAPLQTTAHALASAVSHVVASLRSIEETYPMLGGETSVGGLEFLAETPGGLPIKVTIELA